METITIISLIISHITAIGLVILTARYVNLNKLVLYEMKYSWKPIVTIDIDIREGYKIILKIANRGRSPACKIRIKLTSNIKWRRYFIQGTANFPGIDYLPPDRIIELMIGIFDPVEKELKGKIIDIEMTYEFGEKNEKVIENASFPLQVFELALYTNKNRELKELSSHVHDIANYLNPNSLANSMGRYKMAIGVEKECIYCGKMIPGNAKKCPECKEWIEKQ